VVDGGSIVAASAKLHLTQSAVTRRVQNLEGSLGVSLFDRQTRPLQLTTAGRSTYESAKPVLSAVDDLRSAVTHDGVPSGNFSFGVARGLGDGALTAPIAELRNEFPLLKLQAYAQWSDVLLERVRTRSLDAAAILLPENSVSPANVESEFLCKQPFVIVGPKSSDPVRSIMLKDLALKGWIVSPVGCGMRSSVESVFSRQRLPFSIAVEAEGKDLQLSLVIEGVGLGVVPRQVFQASPHRKLLSVIRVKDFDPIQDLWIIRSKHIGQQSKVFKTLRSVLLRYVQK
jgi:DNA-binding transcriptional LysR family regulator